MRGRDLTGQKFGRLTVIKCIGRSKDRQKLWLCKCECGKLKESKTTYLTSGDTTSCGCYRKECEIKNFSAYWKNTSIKKQYPRLYRIWTGMKTRCYNKNNENFKYYGLRNIKVCDEWKNNFINFKDWAIKNGYDDNLTIDRIDVNKNYCPENCRWATIKEQNNNKRNTKKIKLFNEVNTIRYFADKYSMPRDRIYERSKKNYPEDIILKKEKIVSKDEKGRFKKCTTNIIASL